MHYVYILQSEIDGTYYVGYTCNIDERLNEHNFGRTRYTKFKRPWILVYKEGYQAKSEARKRELYIKKMKSRKFIKELIEKSPAW